MSGREQAKTNRKVTFAQNLSMRMGGSLDTRRQGFGTERQEVKLSCAVLGRLLTVLRTLGSGGKEGLKSILSSTQQVRCPEGSRGCLEKAHSRLICKKACEAVLLGPGPMPPFPPQKFLLYFC